jgi:beta-galactosidase
MEVPWFYSGLHHSSDPAGDTALLDEADRPNPWMSTEFWSVWYDKYGPHPKDASDYARRTWKIISRGGNGYNYYMAFGGSNFGYTNNDEDAASYDYGSAIGQAGDLRPIYYEFKRAAWFARSFQDILENSDDDTASYASVSSNPAIGVSARKSPAGSIVFFDNKQNDREDARIVMKSSGGGVLSTDHLVLEPGEIAGFVKDFELAPGVMIKWSPARIFGIARNDRLRLDLRSSSNLVPNAVGRSVAHQRSQCARRRQYRPGGSRVYRHGSECLRLSSGRAAYQNFSRHAPAA